jgi:hypothetical protein
VASIYPEHINRWRQAQQGGATRDHPAKHRRTPKGWHGVVSQDYPPLDLLNLVKEIFRIVCDFVFLEKFPVFLQKGFPAVVLLLVQDIVINPTNIGMRIRENTIAGQIDL